jgi:cation diffusion facilitator family transporter
MGGSPRISSSPFLVGRLYASIGALVQSLFLMSAESSKKVVVAALAGNLAITACKFTAAILSDSTATLAEAVHSLADSGNQALLLIGMRLALRNADEKYPFGRASELYFWPFVVALMLFSLGGAFGTYEGIRHLFGEEEPLRAFDRTIFGVHIAFSSNVLNYAVLGASVLFESMSFRVAMREFKKTSKGKSLVRAFVEARDPTIPLVLAEDTTALLGLSVALIAVVLRGVTGHAFWDALGSLLIGLLLAAVAIALASVTHGLLIGKAASLEDQARALQIAEDTKGVERVTQILSLHLGPEVIILALKVAFTPKMGVEDVEDITNGIEKRIREKMPRMRKIFIEVDAHGDGRNVDVARALVPTLVDEPEDEPEVEAAG